jgi:predicted DNA binding CopG/RHH family protein
MAKNQTHSDLHRATIRVPHSLWKRIKQAALNADKTIQEYVTLVMDKATPK